MMNLERCREQNYIALGTHWNGRAKGLGDVIIATAVVREVKRKYPDEKILVRVPTFQEVFHHNPHVSVLTTGEGTKNDEGDCKGHYISRMCKFLGIDSPLLKGELFITKDEITKAKTYLRASKPVAIVHIGNPNTVDAGIFSTVALTDKYEFVQVDLPFYREVPVPRIENTNQAFRWLGVRQLIAIISMCEIFIGVNSGPMHIAAAFDRKSVIYASDVYTPSMLYPQNLNLSNQLDFLKQAIRLI